MSTQKAVFLVISAGLPSRLAHANLIIVHFYRRTVSNTQVEKEIALC